VEPTGALLGAGIVHTSHPRDFGLDGRPALRACIISHRTTEADVDALCDSLERARRAA
jgi:hypothetical protein